MQASQITFRYIQIVAGYFTVFLSLVWSLICTLECSLKLNIIDVRSMRIKRNSYGIFNHPFSDIFHLPIIHGSQFEGLIHQFKFVVRSTYVIL